VDYNFVADIMGLSLFI